MSTKPGHSTRPAAMKLLKIVNNHAQKGNKAMSAEYVPVAKGAYHGPAPIPEEGKWVQAKEIKDISGLTHGIGWCAPQQGACKLTLNIKDGVIEEALVETIGCSGMTHSAAMASEILIGKTILEALNTDLVCDAINTAMRELFLQIVYGRSQTAFSEDGLPIGGGPGGPGQGPALPDRHHVRHQGEGPPLSGDDRGLRHPRGAERGREIVGYEFVNLGKMMDAIKRAGPTPTRRWKRRRATTASSTARPSTSTPAGIRKGGIDILWHCLKATREESTRSIPSWHSTASPASRSAATCARPGFDPYDIVKGIQPICFENACWAYCVGAAIALKKGTSRPPPEAAEAIGIGLQAFCIPGSVADDRKVGLGHGNLGAMLLRRRDQVLRLPGRPRVLRRRRGRHRHRPQRQQGPQEPLRVILNGLGKDAAQIISRINGFTYVQTQFDYYTGELKIVREIAYSEGERAAVRCYGADDVREGVAIMHHEGVDVSITGNSTNPTRFQHPVAGTYKKECIEQGKKYFSVASGGGTGRTLHPDNMAAGPASYGMTDTMGRMHSDAQFAGSSSVPAHVEMMGFFGMGNNPMVGATVRCRRRVAPVPGGGIPVLLSAPARISLQAASPIPCDKDTE
jgi:NifU-like protein involved in Fe-S cluster formation